jgi:prevent-host-death family protein
MVVTVHYAKTHLSKLLAAVEAGEEVTIARGDKPVAKLMPVEPAKPKIPRKAGWLKGKMGWNESFWDPLPEEELRLWEGGDD